MPDLSLLEPLSKELDITLNELLAGEEIVKEEAMEYSEQNLIQTIDYTDKKIKNEHKKISLFIIGIGILISLCAFTVFPSESSWSNIYSMIGLFLFVVGIFRELKITSLLKKGLISIILFILLLSIFFIFDYASVTQFKQPLPSSTRRVPYRYRSRAGPYYPSFYYWLQRHTLPQRWYDPE